MDTPIPAPATTCLHQGKWVLNLRARSPKEHPMSNYTPRHFRRFTVTMPDNAEMAGLLLDCRLRSGWKVVGSPQRSSPGRVTYLIRAPNNAVQAHSWPELREAGWAKTPAPAPKTRAAAKRKASRTKRWPRPTSKRKTVFGTPANARQCTSCRQWYASCHFWNPNTRAFAQYCPRCASLRRPRPPAVNVRIDPPDALWRRQAGNKHPRHRA